MRTARIDSDGDWTFGVGRAGYLTGSRAIAQSVVTRLRSFREDWFADVRAGLPWFDLFSDRSTDATAVLREIERVVLITEGVQRIDTLSPAGIENRQVRIQLAYTDVFGAQFNETVTLP